MKTVGEIFKTIVLGEGVTPAMDLSKTIYAGAELGQINYQYGHPLEIVNTLIAMTNSSSTEIKKFPLIAVFMDVQEDVLYKSKIDNLTVIIATDTKQEYTAAERDEYSFHPTLIPLYDSLCEHLKASNDIKWLGEHSRTLRYFWGKQGLYGVEGNIFNDYLDAIEIQFKDLILINNC